MLVRTNVNGEWREADVWPGSSLLYMLREHLGLPGSKNACEQGECGSCSVWLNRELVCACLVLAAQAHEREVRTVEDLSTEDALHPVPDPTEAVIREALSGNLCRCTGYQKIIDAVSLAAGRMRST